MTRTHRTCGLMGFRTSAAKTRTRKCTTDTFPMPVVLCIKGAANPAAVRCSESTPESMTPFGKESDGEDP